MDIPEKIEVNKIIIPIIPGARNPIYGRPGIVIEDEKPKPSMNNQIKGIAILLTILERARKNLSISLSQIVYMS
jgi:hypothetical protein